MFSYFPEKYWGNGSDGDVVISVDTDLNGVVKQYRSLIVNSGVKLYDSTGFLKVFVSDQCVINGSIDQTGQGTTGGAAGIPATYKCNDFYNGNSVAGGSPTSILDATGYGVGGNESGVYSGQVASGGGSAAAGASALGTLPTEEMLGYMSLFNPCNTTHPGALSIGFGAGGGGGRAGSAWTAGNETNDAGALGGAGGNGGGFIMLIARSISGTGSIKADGAAGSAGVDNTNSNYYAGGAGGGGGGGSGGYIQIISESTPSITTSVAAGAGGAAAGRYDREYYAPGVDAWSAAGTAGTTGTIVTTVW